MRSVCVRGMAAGECRPSGVVARSRCRVPGARRQGPRALGPASGGGAGLLLVAAPAWSRDERQAWPVPMTWSARGGRGSTDAGRATRAEQREQSRARPRELALAVLGDGGACGLGWAARRHRARRAGGGGRHSCRRHCSGNGRVEVSTRGTSAATGCAPRGGRSGRSLLGSRAGHAAPHLEWVFHVEHPANRASLSAPARLLQHVRRGPGRCAQRAPCGEPGKLSRAEEDVGRHVKHAPRGSGPGRARGAHASRARSGGRRGAEDWRIGGRRRT